MVLFHNAIKDILINTGGLPLSVSKNIETKKEIKEIKEIKELNNQIREEIKTKIHRMNRNKSMENFVKYSWSWTI